MKALPPRSPWVLALARRYARRRIAHGLDGLRVRGLEQARAAARAGPLIVAANHVGWWDSLLVVALDEALGTEGWALMDGEGLRSHVPYFARLGALPLERAGTAADLRRSLRTAAGRLDAPGRALWMFPQGRYRPAHVRPLGFHRGLSLLARLAPHAGILPVSIAYVQGPNPAPAAVVRIGAVLSAGSSASAGEGMTVGVEMGSGTDGASRRTGGSTAADAERAVEAGLAEIDAQEVDRGWPGWEVVVAPRFRVPERGVGARLLRGRDAADG